MMAGEDQVIQFGIQLIKGAGDLLAHRTKRIYLYGAGRVGKTTFRNVLTKPKMRFKETEDFGPTPGSETSAYDLSAEINLW
ncbi:MAG: hypothetical protein ABI700_07870 [Chloroflexota bacterium]